jgi:hypothetical protein
MTRGTRTALGGGAAVLLTGWSIAQLVLTHRATETAYRNDVAWYHRFVALHGHDHVVVPHPAPARAWLLPGFSSIVAAVALVMVAALLVRGGRRWWALVVVAVPAANAWHGWEDSQVFGWGWMQLSDHYVGWQVAGVATDTFVLTAVAVALAVAVPARHGGGRIPATALRAVPAMLVLAGWWFDRNPLPDQAHEIWLLKALAYVLTVGLLATSRLSLTTRAVAIFGVLPFCSVATSWAAIDGYGVVAQLAHHDLFALATASYVLGVPWLVQRLRVRRAPVPVASGG